LYCAAAAVAASSFFFSWQRVFFSLHFCYSQYNILFTFFVGIIIQSQLV
jgi:hypothetical protein